MDIVGLLPVEISRKILELLPARDLGSCSQVSPAWRSLVDCPRLWRKLCHRYGWNDTGFVDCNRTHKSENLHQQGISEPLWILNKWALNFRVQYSLPRSWERKRSREYLLSPHEGEIIVFSCDERFLALGHADGCVTILNVWKLPKFEDAVLGLLPGQRVLAVQLFGNHLVVLQSKLLQIYLRENSRFKLVDAKSFELGYSMMEVLQKYDGTLDEFTTWYLEQVGTEKYTKEKMSTTIMFYIYGVTVFVAIRDYQMIYGWSLFNGKRTHTIHITNRNCKLRDITLHEGIMYIIYASRNVRHISVYDIANEYFTYEVTTPECKTQKLIVGEYLIGVAIPGPGMTAHGVIKVWNKTNGKEIASRHTGYITFKTVVAMFDLVAYGDGTSVYLWEPKTDTILKVLSVGERISYIHSCPYKFLTVVGNKSTHLWDWVLGNKLYRLYPMVVKSADYRGLIHTDQTMIVLKVDDSVLEMTAFV